MKAPLELLIQLRFRGCRCDPDVENTGVLRDGRVHTVVWHAASCPLLWMAVARWN